MKFIIGILSSLFVFGNSATSFLLPKNGISSSSKNSNKLNLSKIATTNFANLVFNDNHDVADLRTKIIDDLSKYYDDHISFDDFHFYDQNDPNFTLKISKGDTTNSAATKLISYDVVLQAKPKSKKLINSLR